MLNKKWKSMISALLTTSMMGALLVGCGSGQTATSTTTKDTTSGAVESTVASSDEGISDDSPYKGKGFDLSKPANIVMYAIGDMPEDMGKVQDELNTKYLQPWLNSTLEVKFISWADVGTKYSLLLSGGEQVDLMYTASWCNYNSETGNGAFKELSPEFLQTYLPFSYELQSQQSWDQAMISEKIYAIPKNNAAFNNYNMIVMRKDLLDKYGITEINSWDSMKEALYVLAENESKNGILVSGQRGNGEFDDHLWWQSIGTEKLASGYDFMYRTHGKEDLPNWDEDVFYKFDSQECLDFYLEMAEMAAHGVWSENAINDSSDAKTNFVSGKTASLIWNNSILDAGREMEESGTGTFAAFDVTPDTKASRGSYADDMIAIPSSSTQPERAALVLDCLKGFDDVNNLVVGGIEGTHYVLDENGYRTNGESSDKYGWGSWAWGITGKNTPAAYNSDERMYAFDQICEAKEYAPMAAGFTFDKSPVETEMSLISSIVTEYQASFNLGMFGDKTEEKYQEFVGKLHEAGLDRVLEECKAQYAAYCERKS